MERSVEMIAAWLGIWEAGGAFLPLDPQYPAERLAFQLEDSAAAVVITQRRLLGRLPARSAATLVFDADDCRAAAVAVAPDDASLSAACGASARDLAYVIYTSGSTGVPKGVQIEHRALMNLIAWHRQAFKVTAADRASQVASPAFDASVWEIWPYLTAGASVHLPVEEARVAPAQLWRWMAEEQITIGFLPTPVLEAAMNEPWPQRMALRALLTGGDRLKRRPPENFPCELINNYGPTEYTVVATSGPVSAESANPGAPSIGRPVANTHAYIVDREMRLVPMGVPGELALGGESLARGYLNRPELDAEKFVPDPFYRSSLVSRTEATAARQGPARLYRTGDLVRWTEQGDIEYLGRMDGQVKIRGCRIELGEIEAVLGGHPAVRETLVLPRPDGRGELQLIAYVLPHRTGVEDCALLEYLRAKLPAYMVPVAVMLMDAWPLTPNGKIDRHALPAPSPGTPGRTGSSGPLANHTEQTIARVYGEILGRGPIGRDDNFFDLGGHSLLAAQAVSRLNHALQCALSVRTIFDLPTIAGLARELENRGTETVTPRTLKRLKRRSASPAIEILQPN